MKRAIRPLAIIALSACITGCIPRGAPTGPIIEAETPIAEDPKISPVAINTVFNEKPVWESRPVTANAKIVTATTYIVQPGDSLSRIGESSGAGSEAIIRANQLVSPFTLRVGQRLSIPGGRYHTVQSGESGIAIARAYAIRWPEIVQINGLSEPYILRAGQRLLLPSEGAMASAPIAPRTPFRLDIDDILTGGEPANETGVPAARPLDTPTRALPPNLVVRAPSQFAGSFDWPVYGKLASRFGPAGTGEVNDGIDIMVSQGTPVLATSDGVVAFVGNNVAGYGGLILIRHGGGWISAYGRASSAMVTRGQNVKKGQIIGRAGMGATPMIHFELRQGRKPVDPIAHLPRR